MLYTVPLWFNIDYEYYSTPFYEDTVASNNKTQHYTILFNTFVLMNLFNQFNCRKLGWREFNIIDNFFNNIYFFIIVGGEFAAQWFIVALGGDAFRTTPLTTNMHIVCFAFGVGSLGVSALAKLIPDQHASKFALALNENEGAEGDDAISKLTARFTQKPLQKSETERLLDSN
jgi:magnesium-transporting ATPase (P-type)